MSKYAKKFLKEFADGKNARGKDYSKITAIIVAVLDFETVIIEYNSGRGRDVTQESIRLNGQEFVAFLKEAKSLTMISVFGEGSTIKYDRLSLLQEIKERKRAFFDNSDHGSMLDIWQTMPPEPERPIVHSVPKTRRDEIEEMKKNAASQDDSERQLVVRMPTRTQNGNVGTINFL